MDYAERGGAPDSLGARDDDERGHNVPDGRRAHLLAREHARDVARRGGGHGDGRGLTQASTQHEREADVGV